jgi:hypothetical protein
LITLDFKLTSRFNPGKVSRKEQKNWISACQKYRIKWRKSYEGVDLPPRYFAMRLNKRETDGFIYWDFALDMERRGYKTFKKANLACCKAAHIFIEEETRPKRKKRSDAGLKRNRICTRK